jgi:GDP-4-dehydro-6-deoxy-D-mannose reductase
MKVLVTGVGGFVGSHLVAFLRTEHPEVEIVGLRRPRGARVTGPEGCRIVVADLEGTDAVSEILAAERPDRIVHLAAQSSVHRSWADPAGTLRGNVLGLLGLLEALRRVELLPRILVVGSAEEYGAVPREAMPIREDQPLRPASPYAVSKVAQGYLALQYGISHHIPIVRTRTFHHTGPGRSDTFAESSFAKQIAEAALGRREPVISVGNLDAVRDFGDVRDVVRAYWALLDQGEPGEVYNVCTGRGVAVRDVLARIIQVSGIEVTVKVDPDRLRPSDLPVLLGDPAKLQRATGWRPSTSLDTTLSDLLADWLQVLREPTS